MAFLYVIKNLRPSIPRKKGDLIVENISLKLEPSECFGLLGESGRGKTSLLIAALGLFQVIHRSKDAKIDKKCNTWKELNRDSTREIARRKRILALEAIASRFLHHELYPAALNTGM